MNLEDFKKEYRKVESNLKPEEKLHIHCSFFLFEQYPTVKWFHPPNEGKRGWYEQIKLKLMGVKRGVPDFIILEPNAYYYGIVLEAKAIYKNGGKVTLSKDQNIWKNHLIKRGYKFIEFNTVEEFKKEVSNYLSTGIYNDE